MQAPFPRQIPRPSFWLAILLALIAVTAVIGLAARGGAGVTPAAEDGAPGVSDAPQAPTGSDVPAGSGGVTTTDTDTVNPNSPTDSDADPGAALDEVPPGVVGPAPDVAPGAALDEVPPSVVPAACLGFPAPNVFMTFEGKRYRLTAISCGQELDLAALKTVGTTNQIDLDHAGPVTVYLTPEGVLYTQQPGVGDSPTTWDRWEPVE